jgi:hypothetical protein
LNGASAHCLVIASYQPKHLRRHFFSIAADWDDIGLGGKRGKILRAPPKTVLAPLQTFRICRIFCSQLNSYGLIYEPNFLMSFVIIFVC